MSCYRRGLTDHYSFASDINQGIGSTQINSNVVGKKSEEPVNGIDEFHTATQYTYLMQTCKGFLENIFVLQSLIMSTFEKINFWLFGALLFLVPLILWPYTSEVFEFNKMILVYFFTILISANWIARMILEKKFIFRRTILDIPLLFFAGTQLISTFLSIDPLTSWLGYYSRFNGGMLSVICYTLLYWAFVSNTDAKGTVRLIYVTLASAALVATYGVLEHFGIDKNIWVQDVQSRVFSTLGQPNWLAAWLVALIPVTWALMLNLKLNFTPRSIVQSKNFWVLFSLSSLFFWTLIFSKSRSGLAGFGVAYLLFWFSYFWVNKEEFKKCLAPFAVISSSLLIICLISGTQWTPSIGKLFSKSANTQAQTAPSGATALETGGTESGAIRKIVWKGAAQIWLHYPIFGTGGETFAYSYYLYRPAEHNMTSEWNFIYNKAHNEYLNFAANSGTVGLVSYLVLTGFTVFFFIKLITGSSNLKNLGLALLAGYASLLVTNFFGFSVVPTQLELFLFPAIAFAFTNDQPTEPGNRLKKPDGTQKFFLFITFGCGLIVIFALGKYWNADRLYASGVGLNTIGKPDVAINYLTRAIDLEPNQALYYGSERGLAYSYTNLALAFNQQKDADQAAQFSNKAIAAIDRAVTLSPANVNLKRVRFGIFIMLSAIDPNYLIDARDTLEAAVSQAPTDAKLFYNLGLVYARTGQEDRAMETLKKTIELKPDYKEARLAYAFILIDKKQNTEAKIQLEYILTNIDPADSLSKQTLESIK